MNSTQPKGFLDRYGAKLIDAGYDIVPIKRGEKRPPFTGWEKIRADHNTLDTWLNTGYGRCGVGIVTGRVIAVDIDVQDELIAKHMEDWCHEHIGIAPVRVGFPPKRLIVYRTEVPFPKFTSRSFDNPVLPDNDKGKRDRNRIEILAVGQQFVAYAIHPDTKEPYQWLYGEDLLDIPFDNLPIITREQATALAQEYEAQAHLAKWPLIKGTTLAPMDGASRIMNRGQVDDDDPFAADAQQADISEEELHAKLLLVPGADDYDVWLQVGMALFHQFGGGERGVELWHEWSSTADNYDADVLDDKWRTFDISSKGRAPVTARLIIKLAKQAAEVAATETAAELNRALHKAADLGELKAAAAQVKSAELDAPTREQIVGALRSRFKVLTGQVLGIRVARDMVRYENPEAKTLPRWLKDWVYLNSEDKFYNLQTRSVVTQSAFNASYSRFMLTKKDVLEGRASPEQLPTHVALNMFQIPVLACQRYMPGMDEVFSMNGVAYANTYNDRNVPPVPEKLTRQDKRNLSIVAGHFPHLFADERECRIFIDYLAYLVQNPDKRPGWAVLLQGTEGDGKTFFGVMLGAVLGAENVRMVNAKTIQGDFNGWAEGQQVVFVEEIRLHGHNRYDVLNQIKPLITNSVIDIHRKGVDPYNVPNTSSYILATNYRDALPLTENDSRYFVMFSRFQTKLALEAFTLKHPTYYSDLYDAIDQSAGAIRGWLLNHEISEDFSSGNRAPHSRAKEYMAMLAKSEEQQAIEEMLEMSMRWDVSRELLSTVDMADELINFDVEIPYGRKLNKLLSDMGFTQLSRIFIDGRPRRYWTQTPERFIVDGEVDTTAVRDWISMDL